MDLGSRRARWTCDLGGGPREGHRSSRKGFSATPKRPPVVLLPGAAAPGYCVAETRASCMWPEGAQSHFFLRKMRYMAADMAAMPANEASNPHLQCWRGRSSKFMP